MYKASTDWNPRQKRLTEIIRDPSCYEEAMGICLELHSMVHISAVSNSSTATLADEVCGGLREIDYISMPSTKDVTIAWNLWHITRIEDITMNILVKGEEQVFNKQWLAKLNTLITDTGNAMSDDEIIALSKELNKSELLAYRCAVGIKSREIIKTLGPNDMTMKFSKQQVEQIVIQDGLTNHPDSIWLKNFWGRKDVASILLLPLTLHQAGHLNDCLKLKKKCEKF